MKASILKVMSEESWVWRPDNGKTRSSMDISEEFLNAQIRVILHFFFFLPCCDHITDSREQANIVTGLEKSKETVDHENVETGKRDERVRDANMEDDVKVSACRRRLRRISSLQARPPEISLRPS